MRDGQLRARAPGIIGCKTGMRKRNAANDIDIVFGQCSLRARNPTRNEMIMAMIAMTDTRKR